MKVALVFGPTGKSVKPKLQEVKDNLDIDCYDNVPMLIDTSYKRNLHYDRILLLSKNLDNVEIMEDLYEFWSNIGKDTELVFLGKQGKDDNLAKQFVDIFVTPVATAMLLESTTVALIAQSVLQPIQELNKNFGIAGTLNVDVEQGVVLPELKKIADEKKRKEELERKRKEEELKRQEQQKKSSGFLGGLFKKKNKDKNEKQNPVSKEIDTNIESNEFINESSEIIQENPIQEDNYYENTLNDGYDAIEQQEEEIPSFMLDNDVNEDDTDTFEEVPKEEVEEDVDFSNINNSLTSFDNNNFEDVTVEEDDFAPEVEDEDFGNLNFIQDTSVVNDYEETNIVEDEDFSNLNITQAEEAYKKAKETPKVVTKTVVKEVIRNVATSTQLVDKIYNGITTQIIVVTGDRGTGVTTASLSLAKIFSEKVHVLYMDCDVDTHGLLSYINYESFRNYGDTNMQGVKLCKNVRNFQNSCAISYDTNFDILTTDYACDTTDEELEVAAGVVASIADEYGVVIVDCPASKLHCIGDLLIQGVTVVTVEATKRGFMNMLCTLENSPLPIKYKRTICGKGTMFITKSSKHTDLKKLVNYVKTIVESEDVDWVSMKKLTFDGKLTDIMINSILER